MIAKLKQLIKGIIKPTPKEQKKETLQNDKVLNDKSQSNYLGVPAPVVAPYDPWFSEPVKTEKMVTYEKQVEQQKSEEIQTLKEPENIHQKMYEIATKSWSTWQENLGGSENCQSGPGGWNSGNGMSQFRP